MAGKRVLDGRDIVREVPPPDFAGGDAELNELRAAVHGVPSGLGPRLMMGAVVGVVFGVLIYRETIRLMGAADAFAGIMLGAIVAAATVFAFVRLGVRPPDMQQIWEAFHRTMRCPCCGYDLRSLKAASDGCTECPECGAAWRMAKRGDETDQPRDG